MIVGNITGMADLKVNTESELLNGLLLTTNYQDKQM
jgi:hypothetical protein